MIRETMSPIERIRAAIEHRIPDRVPVAPFILHHVARVTGITIDEFLFDFRKSRTACRQAYDIYEQPDMVTWFPTPGYILFGGEQLLFGTEWIFKQDQPAQILEKQQWEVEDYDRLVEEGIARKMLRRPAEGLGKFLRSGLQFRNERSYWEKKRRVSSWIGSVTVMPFEWLSWKRSLVPFITDIHRHPDKILRASDFVADGLVELAKIQCTFSGLKRVFFDSNRASASFISPKVFEALVLPSLKRMVSALVEDGYEILFHLDTDWVPMLPFFLEFPKGRYIMELEHTDIREAKRILKGHICIKGNISSTLLRLGSPEEVEDECRKLIEDLGEGGGFILGSGCEVPFDAPLDNVLAMIRSVRKYGWY